MAVRVEYKLACKRCLGVVDFVNKLKECNRDILVEFFQNPELEFEESPSVFVDGKKINAGISECSSCGTFCSSVSESAAFKLKEVFCGDGDCCKDLQM